MTDLSQYSFSKNTRPDPINSAQAADFATLISYAIGHFITTIEPATVINTIFHFDEGPKGTKFRLNVIVKTDSLGLNLITMFGALKYLGLKLAEVKGERKSDTDPWHYDRCISVVSERGAYRSIDDQIGKVAAHQNPLYAHVASAQLMSCFGGPAAEIAAVGGDDGGFSAALPVILTDQETAARSAWSGDW